MRPEPASEVVGALLAHVRDAMEDTGDLAAAEEAVGRLMERGTGARTQRDVFARTGSLRAVVAECVSRTRG